MDMLKKTLEEGRIVLCTVDRVVGTVVFVKIDDYGLEGTITFSEIAPGRIRNIRDFVFPGKKIVCKILRINPSGIDLSLRRVKLKEMNELNEQNRREKSYVQMFKSILGGKAEKAIEKIKEKEESLVLFLEKVRENPEMLDGYLAAEDAARIKGILEDKKVKEVILSRKFSLINKGPKGIVFVKSIISEAINGINCEVSYIAAGKYLIKMKAADAKKADNLLEGVIKNLEVSAKKSGSVFSAEK